MSKRLGTTDTRSVKRTRVRCSLLWASHTNNVEAVKQHLELGVEPTLVNGLGQTPLHVASRLGYTDIVRLLLEDGTYDPNENDYELQTPLMLACAGGFLEIVRLLMADVRVDPNWYDHNGTNALMKACGEDLEDEGEGGSFLEIVHLLLSDGRVDPNKSDFKGLTPLMRACQVFSAREGREHCPKGSCGKNEGLVQYYDGSNNFCEECIDWMRTRNTEQIEIVRLLLADERVNPNKTDREGATALLYCTDREEIMSLMLSDNRVERKQICMTSVFPTPLHIACCFLWTNNIRLLLNTPGYNYKIKGDDSEWRAGISAFKLTNCGGNSRKLSSFQLAGRRRECKRLFLTLTTHLIFARQKITTDLASEVCKYI